MDGRKEDKADMLKPILAEMEYQHQVCYWDSNGVPFRTYNYFIVYIPEIHPITGKEFHEREDFAHVLKLFNIKFYMGVCVQILIVHNHIENGTVHKKGRAETAET